MKFVRYQSGAKISWGILEGETIHEVTGDVMKNPKKTGETAPLSSVKLLAPCENPQKLLAIGLNYALHAGEAKRDLPKEPIIFFKSQTSVTNPDEDIVIFDTTHKTDHEAELVAIIGKTVKNATLENALDYVWGYTCGNDVSDRTLQRQDLQWTRAKSFDTYAPLGPWVVTDLDPSALDIKCIVNGETKQNSNTKHLIFDVKQLIVTASECMTLFPGDVIMTGTPEGVSPIKPGDVVEVVIEGIGTLKNKVVGK
jgi:2-keto-4-pentenoate hydratase/2-oxohepta-3-ene-1,7-dioic acid hydratase in catechol pathway